MRMVERQEKAGIRRYEDIAKDIRDHEGLRFGTPKHRDVKIKGIHLENHSSFALID